MRKARRRGIDKARDRSRGRADRTKDAHPAEEVPSTLDYPAPRSLLVRYAPRRSPIDGSPVQGLVPFTDEELWLRVEDLSDDEFRRLCKLWQTRREDPWRTVPALRSALEQVQKLQGAPRLLRRRRGRHRGRLGDDPVQIELSHQFLKRLHVLTLRALSDTGPRKRRDPGALVDRILAGLGQHCLITGGPLKDQVVSWGDFPDDVRLHLRGAVQDVLPLRLRSDRSRATEIVLTYLSRREHPRDSVSLRQLQLILNKKTRSPRPLHEVNPPVSA